MANPTDPACISAVLALVRRLATEHDRMGEVISGATYLDEEVKFQFELLGVLMTELNHLVAGCEPDEIFSSYAEMTLDRWRAPKLKEALCEAIAAMNNGSSRNVVYDYEKLLERLYPGGDTTTP